MYQSSYDTLSKGFLEHYYIYHIQIFFNIYLYRLWYELKGLIWR